MKDLSTCSSKSIRATKLILKMAYRRVGFFETLSADIVVLLQHPAHPNPNIIALRCWTLHIDEHEPYIFFIVQDISEREMDFSFRKKREWRSKASAPV